MVAVAELNGEQTDATVTTKKKKMKKSQTKKPGNEEETNADNGGGLEKEESQPSNDDKVPSENPTAKTGNKRKRLQKKKKKMSEEQATPEVEEEQKTAKKKKVSLETAEKSMEEKEDTDDEGENELTPEVKLQKEGETASSSLNTLEEFKSILANYSDGDEEDEMEEDDDEKPPAKHQRGQVKERDPEQEERTIFVGNVDIKAKRRDIKKYFQTYGHVEAVRCRNAAIADPAETKKVAMIKGNFHKSQTTYIAYVRFKNKETAIKALEANNKEYMGKHLQVDLATGNRKIDGKCSVFVGNLPFDAQEEELRDAFKECGDIENIRIVRDRQLGSGKGFGYVNFKAPDAAELALTIDGTPLKGRPLRVKRYMMKEQVEKRQKMWEKKTQVKPKKMRLNFMAGNRQGGRKQGSSAPVGKSFAGEKFKAKNMKKKKEKKFTKDDKKKMAISKMLTGNNSAGVEKGNTSN
ncbi:RNA-binding protein 34-like [Penaeus japonicus]|uniref:RNA-binding protein 34-like n=1 Tax=Penaeus japonicus TaxID=27405 RepID=UPI001C70F60E|nr:RNA-binding protein 34-like [Penaeus japonicus]